MTKEEKKRVTARVRAKQWYQDNKERKREYDRQYREANKVRIAEQARERRESRREEIATKRRRRYEENRERVLTQQKRYREANKEKVSERNRKYREANKEKLAEKGRKYREANKEKVSERYRKYREANKEKLAETEKRWREANKERVAETKKRWREANKEKLSEQGKTFREANKDRLAARANQYYQANKDVLIAANRHRNSNYPPELYSDKSQYQSDKCAICNVTGKTLCADHCHAMGEPRGLLCSKCNWALGFLNDSRAAIHYAIEYLGKGTTSIRWVHAATRRHYKREYNLPRSKRWREIAADLLAKQGNRCPILHVTSPGGKYNRWHIDHCHKTGMVRGILSHNANTALGLFNDDPELLQRAINYLNWYSPSNIMRHCHIRFDYDEHLFFLAIAT